MGKIAQHMCQRHLVQESCSYCALPATHPDNAWPTGRSVQTVARSTTLEKFAEAEEIQPCP